MNIVNLSAIEKKELQRKCSNNLNWSDGGNWIGNGFKPNCSILDRHTSVNSLIVNFPSDASANKWNLLWEEMIRKSGHVGTVSLTAAITLISSPSVGVIVGSLASILKDELQAKVPYPKMERGWSYEVILQYDFIWSPLSSGPRRLDQIITSISKNHESKIIYEGISKISYKLSELPDGLGRSLAMKGNKRAEVNFM